MYNFVEVANFVSIHTFRSEKRISAFFKKILTKTRTSNEFYVEIVNEDKGKFHNVILLLPFFYLLYI